MPISKYKQQLIEECEDNDKTKILKIIYGKKAYNIAKYLFFYAQDKDIGTWGNHWNDYEKNTCVLIIYEYRLRVNKRIHIKLIIGRETSDYFSIVGEKYSYSRGIDLVGDFI